MKIKDICYVTKLAGFEYSKHFSGKFEEEGIPLIQGKNIKNNSLDLTDVHYISEELSNSLPRSQVDKNSILFCYICNIGDCWINSDGLKLHLGSNVAKINVTDINVIPSYLFYWLQSPIHKKYIYQISKGSAQKNINMEEIRNIDIDIPKKEIQQHIVNTIGSVDDLIENKQKQIDLLLNIGLIKINTYNQSKTKLISKIASFEKGQEIGSANYIDIKNENSIPYLRVGDLQDNNNCVYVDSSLAQENTSEDDIIVAFDGSPGRNAICLSGVRSSGLYKIVCDKQYKGLLYFEMNSKLNKSIIKNHSQGTTILHASKAISYLEFADIDERSKETLNYLFNQILTIKKQINKLKLQKQLLLDKYFTNQ